MKRWIRAIGIWFVEGELLWFASMVIAGALVVAFLPPLSEQRIRLTGWGLEALGLITVGLEIRKARRDFDKPPLFALAVRYFGAFPKFHPTPVHGGVDVRSSSAGSLTASGHQPEVVVSNRTEGERLSDLEARMDIADASIIRLRDDLKTETNRREAAVKEALRTTTAQSSKIRKELEETATGSLYLSVVGLVWVALGATLDTLPNELIWIARWIFGGCS